jgi:hypothetical protein
MDKKSSRVHSAGSPSQCNYHKEFPVMNSCDDREGKRL